MNQNRSVATIDAPEFINLEPDAINPGISKCEIKVLYLGKNRNGSYINKNVAIQMANSLPGTPIVGAFSKDKDDFEDHGEVIHMENGKIEFSCKTFPYGFVAPDANVWFQKFTDTNDFGEEVVREYLMTNGYLWTGAYPEVTECITSGKGQSMELDPENIDGHWARDDNTGIEFFIINDAIFTKLCILGDDVEPCFEGAAVTSPEVSKNFSYESKDFSRTLFTMMNELKFALQNKGGSDMPNDQEQLFAVTEEVEASVETSFEATSEEAAEVSEDFTAETEGDTDTTADEYACGNKKEKYAEEGEKEKNEESTPEESDEDAKEETTTGEEEDKKPSSKHSADEFELLESEIVSLRAELDELRQFKLAQDEAKKDALINQYHMLSDDDKAEIIAHKSEYSYEDIEAKLALLYVKKNVDFSTLDGQSEVAEEVEEDPSMTFSLEDSVAGSVPAFVEALRKAKRS